MCVVWLIQPGVRAEVQAHTDSVGTVEYNQDLSQRRAASVRAYLISQGIDAGRLVPKGYGESQPIATNMYKAGRAKNRRVELKIISDH